MLDLILDKYIYKRGFIPRVQNYVPDHIEIYQFRGAVIESYAPHFADGSTGPGHSIDHPVCVVLWPPHENSEMLSEGRNSEVISPICPLFQ